MESDYDSIWDFSTPTCQPAALPVRSAVSCCEIGRATTDRAVGSSFVKELPALSDDSARQASAPASASFDGNADTTPAGPSVKPIEKLKAKIAANGSAKAQADAAPAGSRP